MSLEGKHLVVVGGGIGGATTAVLAARAGARVTLLERATEPRTVGAGLVLQANGLAVLYGLGLDERLPRRGVRVRAMRIADARDRTILDVPVPSFAGGLDHALVVRRDDLLAAVYDLVDAEPGITCRFGREVLEASALGEVVHRDASGAVERLTGDVVVAADGVHSAVRRHGGIAARIGRGLRYVRGIGPELALHGMTEYWTALGVFGVAPLRHGSYFYASVEAEPVARALRDGDVRAFRERWSRELPLAAAVLADLDWPEELVAGDVVRVDCDHWTSGRVVLLGDAAHAMAPNLGQGAGSTLADAAVLVWELAQPGALATALVRYEARRRPAVRPVQNLADVLGRMADRTPSLLRPVRDAVVRVAAPRFLGEVGMRLVEQQDPLWLRMAAEDPTDALAPPWLVRPHADVPPAALEQPGPRMRASA